MLGFPSHNEPIKEPYASQLREKLMRYTTKNYSKEDLAEIKRSKEILSKYHAVWKDK